MQRNYEGAEPGSNQAIAIRAEGLTRRFGEMTAVDRLSFEVERGEVFGCLGHNGAGKTTTVRLLNGVLSASAGQATVLGLSPASQGAQLRRRTGVLTETPALDDRLTARESLLFAADLFGVPTPESQVKVGALLDHFDLAARADDRVGGFSKGMKQRLALARALIHDPELLFLDEPTSGLDPVASRHVHEMIRHVSRGERRTVFLSTHNLVEAQNLCDRVVVLEQGRIVALGTPAELAQRLSTHSRLEIEVAPESLADALVVLQRDGTSTGAVIKDLRLVVSGVERARIPVIVSRLVEAGVPIFRVSPHEPTLEDAYFALTGKAPR